MVAGRPFFYSSSPSVAAAVWGRAAARRRRAGELGARGDVLWPLVAGWELGRAPWRPAARQVFDQSLWLLFEIFEKLATLKNVQTSIEKRLGEGWPASGIFPSHFDTLVICLYLY